MPETHIKPYFFAKASLSASAMGGVTDGPGARTLGSSRRARLLRARPAALAAVHLRGGLLRASTGL